MKLKMFTLIYCFLRIISYYAFSLIIFDNEIQSLKVKFYYLNLEDKISITLFVYKYIFITKIETHSLASSSLHLLNYSILRKNFISYSIKLSIVIYSL